MPVVSRATLKTYLITGARPTQSNFIDLVDSLVSMNGADESASILGAKRFAGSVLVTGSLVTGGAASIAGSVVVNAIVTLANNVNTNASRITFDDVNIAHGITTQTATTVFGEAARFNTCGGFTIRGLSGSTIGVQIVGAGVTDDLSRGNTSVGVITLQANKKSGTTFGRSGSLANLFVIQDSSSARFIFGSGGDLYTDSGVTASSFETFDDMALLRTLEVEIDPALRNDKTNATMYDREALRQSDLLHTFIYKDENGNQCESVFVNQTRLARLQNGAMFQAHKRLQSAEQMLGPLHQRLRGVETHLSVIATVNQTPANASGVFSSPEVNPPDYLGLYGRVDWKWLDRFVPQSFKRLVDHVAILHRLAKFIYERQ